MFSPRTSLPDSKAVISVLFDTHDPKQCEVLRSMRALLQGYGDVEALNESLFVLHILPGAAQELLP